MLSHRALNFQESKLAFRRQTLLAELGVSLAQLQIQKRQIAAAKDRNHSLRSFSLRPLSRELGILLTQSQKVRLKRQISHCSSCHFLLAWGENKLNSLLESFEEVKCSYAASLEDFRQAELRRQTITGQIQFRKMKESAAKESREEIDGEELFSRLRNKKTRKEKSRAN